MKVFSNEALNQAIITINEHSQMIEDKKSYIYITKIGDTVVIAKYINGVLTTVHRIDAGEIE